VKLFMAWGVGKSKPICLIEDGSKSNGNIRPPKSK